jgi:CelD/BcsL family acetyltransferase involved in cellulose biosynthesis
MSWETYPAIAWFPKFAEDWDRLNTQLYKRHPFFDSRFVGPLLDYFARGRERLCIYRANGVISGALILRADGIGRWSSFLPSQAQASAILLDDACLLQSLLKTLPGFAWEIEFYAIDPRYSPDFSRLELPKIISANADTIGIHPDISFTDFWNKRSKNVRANIRRYLNRAKKEFATPVLSKITDQTEIYAGVDRYGALESAGWKASGGTAVASGNIQGKFYSEVLGRFAQSNQAIVYELYLGDQLAASRLVIASDHIFIILKTTYDEELARFAPGQILLHQVIKDQLECQAEKIIEFYTNATPEQMNWSTFTCTIQNIQLFRNESVAAIFSMLKVVQRKLRDKKSRRAKSDRIKPSASVEACTSIEAFTTAEYDLREFAARDNIEVSIDWFDLLQKNVYPVDPGIRYYFVAEDKRPSTILPLRLSTKGRVKTVESLGNYYTSLYTPLLTKDSDLLALRHMLAAATRDHGGAHVMRFAPMNPESPAYRCLFNELHAVGWIPFRFFCFGNWFLRVEDDWQGYLKKRSANLRSSIKRRSKELAAAGGTLEVVSSTEGIEQAIADFQEVYSASWKIPEPYTDFVPSLIRRLSSIGMLRLGIARLQKRPIAAQLWIVGQGKASIYKVAYHNAFAAFSPGTVLTSHLLQHVIEQDHVKEVDFLTGDDEYKQFWMSDRRERWGIVAYNPRTIIGFALFIQEVSGRIAKSTEKRIKEIFLKSQHIRAAFANFRTGIRIKHFQLHTAQRDHVMTWTLHPVAQLAEYASQWDALVRTRPGTPFLESAFLQPSVDSFGSGNELLCLLHSNGRLRAAAIMQRRGKGIWQTFQPSQLPLGAWISDGKVDLVSACSELMRQLPSYTLVSAPANSILAFKFSLKIAPK